MTMAMAGLTCHAHTNAYQAPLLPLVRSVHAGALVASGVRAGHGGYLRHYSVCVGAGADRGDHQREGPSPMDLLQVSLPCLRVE